MEKYDYEVAFVDMWVKKIIDAVDELGLADNTAIVIHADHGEAWGEHKVYFHGQDLFDEQLRVPLIFVVPGHAPQVSDEPVALGDVAPTRSISVGATSTSATGSSDTWGDARAQPASDHPAREGGPRRPAASDLRRASARD